MNIESHNMGAYNLHFIKTDKFKTINISVNFYRAVKKEEITKRNLLKMVLLNSNNNYKAERDLIIKSEELYDIKISSGISRIGNFSNLSFETKFLNEVFTEEDMNTESIVFFLNLIFNPYVENGKFVNVDKEKNTLKEDILRLKDNKIKYAILKLFEKVKDKPYTYNTFGLIEDLDKIDGKELYDYYKSVISEDQIDIFVLGDFDSKVMKEIFRQYFKVVTFKKENKNITVSELPPRKRIIKYTEYDKVKQSQLTILCSLNNLTDFERKYTIKLYNELLGGSSNSILFSKVREDKNYCYYINANVKAYDNILFINSGIEKKNIESAIRLIRKCLKDMQAGKIDDDMIDAAKNIIISAIKTAIDEPNGIIVTAFSKVLVNSDDVETKIKNFSKITKEDLIAVSKKVSLHTVLILEGDNNDGQD